jgi:LacI family transcriptional regulator
MKLNPRPPRVALLVETSLSSGQDILFGIGQYIREHAPWSVYAQPHDLEQAPPSWFRNWSGDGIIARLQDERILNAVATKRVPVVDVLGVHRKHGIPLVHVENAAIAAMAAEHLLDRGFIHFAFLGISGEYWSEERCAGFTAYLAERNHTCRAFMLSRQGFKKTDWHTLVSRVAKWLGGLQLPAGIMLCSDVQGLLVREACQTADLVIGDQVALVGVGNDRTLCEMITPTLSSVEANHVQVGYEAAALLDRLMQGKKPPKAPILIKPWYVAVRESTDFLGVNDAAIARALHYIRNHCTGSVQLDTVAQQAGLSRSVLQRRFRRLLGRSVHNEVVNARLHKAMALLRHASINIDQVAEQSGFGYAQNMGRVFHRHFGRSPKEYRRRLATNDDVTGTT